MTTEYFSQTPVKTPRSPHSTPRGQNTKNEPNYESRTWLSPQTRLLTQLNFWPTPFPPISTLSRGATRKGEGRPTRKDDCPLPPTRPLLPPRPCLPGQNLISGRKFMRFSSSSSSRSPEGNPRGGGGWSERDVRGR
ncbi:hypothetical protein CEXT_334051 [Caerostris extrusa]|uniref:Uncharacterized protein n=1 Tax=Caerostris extrusa TaxID=172846 RepID=A0AAV4XZV8_CAEEX|nr:hypothetical protein CEXT_334051 [Caerostris extrusa]